MKFLKICVLMEIVALAMAINLPLINVLETGKDIAKGIAATAMSLVPTPEYLFEGSKQLLLGYPNEIVSDIINKFCSASVSAKAIVPKTSPDVNKIYLQLRTKCLNYSVPILKADDLWHYEHFDLNKKVVVLATGWRTTINESSGIEAIAKAYNCRGDVNLVALDAASFVDTLYSWSALNTEEIGMYLGTGLAELVKAVPVENIHLIGHSLGAHIMGAAGRYFQYLTNQSIPRITGLDPAKPCFNEGEVLSGLLRGDADFIDVIHSNPGVLGKRTPLGDIDFYPGGLAPLATGCLDILCSHSKAWQYYAESVYPGNENNFIGSRCTSLTKLNNNKCGNNLAVMGYAASTDQKGNYFLNVRANSPFGTNADMENVMQMENCGLCEADNQRE